MIFFFFFQIQKDPFRPRARLCSRRIHPGTPPPAPSRDRDLVHAPQCRRICGMKISERSFLEAQKFTQQLSVMTIFNYIP